MELTVIIAILVLMVILFRRSHNNNPRCNEHNCLLEIRKEVPQIVYTSPGYKGPIHKDSQSVNPQGSNEINQIETEYFYYCPLCAGEEI